MALKKERRKIYWKNFGKLLVPWSIAVEGFQTSSSGPGWHRRAIVQRHARMSQAQDTFIAS